MTKGVRWRVPRVKEECPLDALMTFVRAYVEMPAAALRMTVLWVAHTYVVDRFAHSPRLVITSPLERCGKSTLLELLNKFCRQPIRSANTTLAATLREVDGSRRTVLMDEFDTVSDRNKREELRCFINASYEKEAEQFKRAGSKGAVKTYSVFAPVAISGIGIDERTVIDRAIVIELQRRQSTASARPPRLVKRSAEIVELRLRLETWVQKQELDTDPAMPHELDDRAMDYHVPLFAIADSAGKMWSKPARKDALSLSQERRPAPSSAEHMLRAMAFVFSRSDETAHSSMACLSVLTRLQGVPWEGRQVTALELSRCLQGFGIKPTQNHVGRDRRNLRGYRRNDVESAWKRYAPDAEPPEYDCVGDIDALLNNVAYGEPPALAVFGYASEDENPLESEDPVEAADVAELADSPSTNEAVAANANRRLQGTTVRVPMSFLS
jgi:Protein of unknown function (DUF3631)